MKNYKGYLIDLDGTMFRGNEPIDGAKAFIDWLQQKQIPYVFVTNNSSATLAQVAAKLNRMEIAANEDQVITSSKACANYIKNKVKDPLVYMIGEEGLYEALKAKGISITDQDDANVVVIGIDRDINYEKLANAALAVRKGAVFISTNSDVAIPSERGLLPGNGSLTAVISVSTGQEPTFIGKPEPIIINEALNQLDLPKKEIMMVGDNYATDITAGIRAGIDTLMVFTGVTQKEELPNLEIQPTYYVDNLRDWVEKIIS